MVFECLGAAMEPAQSSKSNDKDTENMITLWSPMQNKGLGKGKLNISGKGKPLMAAILKPGKQGGKGSATGKLRPHPPEPPPPHLTGIDVEMQSSPAYSTLRKVRANIKVRDMLKHKTLDDLQDATEALARMASRELEKADIDFREEYYNLTRELNMSDKEKFDKEFEEDLDPECNAQANYQQIDLTLENAISADSMKTELTLRGQIDSILYEAYEE